MQNIMKVPPGNNFIKMIYSFFLKDKKFYIYILIGGTAAIINIASRYVLSITKIISFELSVVIAYFLGMIWNFVLNKYFNFKSFTRKIGSQFLTFIIIAVLGLVLTLVFSMLFKWILKNFTDLNTKLFEFIAHITSVALVMLYSFMGHKIFTFRKGIVKEISNLQK